MGDCVMEPEQDYVGKTGHQPPPHITRAQNIWPERAPWWREGMYKYYSHVMPLAMKLVKIFALAFDQDETSFDQDFKFPITGMRALHYPPTPSDEESPSIGLGAHADFSCKSRYPPLDTEFSLTPNLRAHPRPPRLRARTGDTEPGRNMGRCPSPAWHIRLQRRPVPRATIQRSFPSYRPPCQEPHWP